MADAAPPNGAPPTVEPLKVATEVYILDTLIANMKFAAAQLQFRGKLRLAEQIGALAVVVGPGQAMLLQAFREQVNIETYGKTESGLLLATNLPRG